MFGAVWCDPLSGVIDFKLWPAEDWKACGAYRCFNK
jgi:hypothetical protein